MDLRMQSCMLVCVGSAGSAGAQGSAIEAVHFIKAAEDAA